jgi:hypothetical protein
MPDSNPQFDANDSDLTQPRRTRWFFVTQEFVEDEQPATPASPENTHPAEQVVDSQAESAMQESTLIPRKQEQPDSAAQSEPEVENGSVTATPIVGPKKKAIVTKPSTVAEDQRTQTPRVRIRRRLKWPNGESLDAQPNE